MKTSYSISFPEPHTHYAEVTLHISGNDQESLEVYMPVWTPGSYLIREFSRNIEGWTCHVPSEKISKNTWRISAKGHTSISISYRVYAFEMSVRTSFIDSSQAYLNGASVFLAVKAYEHLPIDITFVPDPSWANISTALRVEGHDKWNRIAENYDELVDSPVIISNHTVLTFTASGIPHEVALVGESNMDEEEFIDDLTAICEEEISLFGEYPAEKYLFIIHHTDGLNGGLEHLHCSSNFISRWRYVKGERYNAAMSLLAHEYFHLWNGKRIRPETLGPFDYNNENYTRLLWAVEGLTSYYDDYITYRAGIETRAEYLGIVANNISEVVNRPGDQVQSLGESSFDTWIKYYRPNENTLNSQVNYYGKGAAIAVALNFLIMHETKGERLLDDVMRLLYKHYRERPDKGYTEQEILAIFEEVSGKSLKDFFEKHIYGTEVIDYTYYFALSGFELTRKRKKSSDVNPGWTMEKKEGRFLVNKVERGGSAYESGINVNDELIAINGYRVTDQYDILLAGKTVGETIPVMVSRQGIIHELSLRLLPDTRVEYVISENPNATAAQKLLGEKWLDR